MSETRSNENRGTCMATVERSAYPRIQRIFLPRSCRPAARRTPKNLSGPPDLPVGQGPRLGLLVLLKVFQQPHYFPNLDSIPVPLLDGVVDIVADGQDDALIGHRCAASSCRPAIWSPCARTVPRCGPSAATTTSRCNGGISGRAAWSCSAWRSSASSCRTFSRCRSRRRPRPISTERFQGHSSG